MDCGSQFQLGRGFSQPGAGHSRGSGRLTAKDLPSSPDFLSFHGLKT